ncbi:MAG: PQQ-binding-like beta-propeller repeat protein [Clostridium sp.]|uniref:outer membrane protein assembly factor BamB family protein n=1 Tax=Clostridium sp. TaxID=1506 RepID=UPI003F2CA9E8
MKKNFIFSLIICTLSLSLVSCGSNPVTTPDTSNDIDTSDSNLNKEEDSKPLSKINVKYLDNKKLSYSNINPLKDDSNIIFDKEYSDIEGVLTFRGNNYRTSPSFGVSSIDKKELDTLWTFKTSSSSWGGGAGWTGQTSLVKWPEDIKEKMNLTHSFKNKKDGVEVIYASLDGNIYFLDLETGEKTRPKINIGNPIKGSLSIDPRGLPLLYVGEGINEGNPLSFNIYSLIDGKKLYEIKGNDKDATRAWGAFDSSPLIDKDTDTVFAPGENGLIYKLKLNSKYDKEKNIVSVNPKVSKYKYNLGSKPGIESSMAAYANLGYVADNNGFVQCIDLNNMKPVWFKDLSDDTDATLTLDIENDTPFIYAGNEVDKQGAVGYCKIKKLNGLNGDISWEKSFKCESLLGSSPVNGGMLSTPAVLKDTVVFSLSRYDGFNSGVLLSLDKKTGDIVWEKKLDNYAWSSPTNFKNSNGDEFLVQGDSVGNLFLIDGKTGETLDTLSLDANIEASPAIFNDTLVVASRNGTIYGINIK